jgi:cytochrome c oxidase subunit 2
VTGQRFAWAFSTTPVTGKDGNAVVIKSGDLHTFIGQRVHLEMNASDVIHSFWAPAMRVKQDLIPGRTTEIRFVPAAPPDTVETDFPLSFAIRCAELCGGGHGAMTSTVIVYAHEEQFLNAFYNVE